MKIAYLDCFSGISGDMFIGALLDTGLPLEDLARELGQTSLSDYRLDMRREERNQIFGTRFIVEFEEKKQPARNLKQIRELILKSNLKRAVVDKSIEIFEALAAVEGHIHNRPPEAVHFHEIGGVDSLIDIIGTVYAVDQLGIDSIYASPLPLGMGFVKTDHGKIPVPAPATVALLKEVPVTSSGIRQEMVTPTGAVLVKKLASGFGPMPPMVIRNIGYGVGKRKLKDRPNLLRIIIGETQSDQDTDRVLVMETNIDDANPEFLGHLMENLFIAGALDVVFFPVYMKKNRPGVQMQIIGRPEEKDRLMKIVFNESATLGIRFRHSERKTLKRSHEKIHSPWGMLKVKKVIGTDGIPFFQPEYEVCRRIALKNHLPLREVFNWVHGLNMKGKG